MAKKWTGLSVCGSGRVLCDKCGDSVCEHVLEGLRILETDAGQGREIARYATEQLGWDGVNNSKILSVFIKAEFESLKAHNEYLTRVLKRHGLGGKIELQSEPGYTDEEWTRSQITEVKRLLGETPDGIDRISLESRLRELEISLIRFNGEKIHPRKIHLRGNWKDQNVFINGELLTVHESLKVYNHSPDGFSWGYGGSGPAQLALAILLACVPREMAICNYQQFKWDVIAKLPQSDFEVEVELSPYLK
jgi:hypothetical protein